MPDPTPANLRKAIEAPRIAYLWGQPSTITPRLCSKVFGNGQLVVTLQPLNTRPERYLVRVDSSVWGDGDDFDDNMGELIDSLLDALEDEYGRAWDPCEDDEDACADACGSCEWCGYQAWPRVDDRSGTGWGRWGSLDEVAAQLQVSPLDLTTAPHL